MDRFFERKFLAVPLDEIELQFAKNSRQDVKIVVPTFWDAALMQQSILTEFTNIKAEIRLKEETWCHSEQDEPNKACEANEFGYGWKPNFNVGPICVAFANEKAEQHPHLHSYHFEIYFSSYPIQATYRTSEDDDVKNIDLPKGGLMIFGPNVTHMMRLSGITVVIEVPAVEEDKKKDII